MGLNAVPCLTELDGQQWEFVSACWWFIAWGARLFAWGLALLLGWGAWGALQERAPAPPLRAAHVAAPPSEDKPAANNVYLLLLQAVKRLARLRASSRGAVNPQHPPHASTGYR